MISTIISTFSLLISLTVAYYSFFRKAKLYIPKPFSIGIGETPLVWRTQKRASLLFIPLHIVNIGVRPALVEEITAKIKTSSTEIELKLHFVAKDIGFSAQEGHSLPSAKNFESFIVKGGEVVEKIVGFWIVFDEIKLKKLKKESSFEFLLNIISKNKILASTKWKFNIGKTLEEALTNSYLVYPTNENTSIENILNRR